MGHCNNGRGLSLPVNYGHLAAIQALHHASHQLSGARRSADEVGANGGDIEARKLRMLQQGDEHSGYAGDHRGAFIFDGRKHCAGIELG